MGTGLDWQKTQNSWLHTSLVNVASWWLKGFKGKNIVSEWKTGISVCRQSILCGPPGITAANGFFSCGFPSLQVPVETP